MDARAAVISVESDGDIEVAATRASQVLGKRIGIDAEKVNDCFLETGSLWIQPSDTHPTATPVAFFEDADDDHLVIVRCDSGIVIPSEWGGRNERVNALFFLAGTSDKPGRALRLAGELAAYLHDDEFAVSSDATHEAEVKQALLPGLEIGQYPLLPETAIGILIGRTLGEINLDSDLHIEAINRGGKVLRADPETKLLADDQLTIIGPIGELPGSEDLARKI